MLIAMIILGVLTVISALAVVLAKSPLNSALWLVLTLFFVAGHFALMGAQFVAAVQIMVYAGAIMVLVIFVIMLLGTNTDSNDEKVFSPKNLLVAFVLFGFIYVLGSSVLDNPLPNRDVVASTASVSSKAVLSNTKAFGAELFTKYLLPFEITSILLLAALIGAVVLALEPKRALPPGRGLRAKQGS